MSLLTNEPRSRQQPITLDAREALRQSEEDLRALANSIPQLAWMANPDGSMVWFNERWYAYTGATPQQLADEGWRGLYAPDCIDLLEQRWRHSLHTGARFEMEVPIRGADGQFRWFLMRANPVRNSSGKVLRWFGTSTDVDQVKRAQEALRDETAVLEVLYSTGNALASTRDLQPLLQEVIDAATRISGARYGALLCHTRGADGAAQIQHTLARSTPPGFASLALRRASAVFRPGLHSTGTVRRADLLNEPDADPAQANGTSSDQPAVRSYLAAPVVARTGEVIGTLVLGHVLPDIFSERSERIIGGIAAQAAVAIDNARLVEATQQAARERQTLLDSERRAREEAERTSQMKDDFLATLSHELRTPLTAILGWAQVLRRGSRDTADLQRGLETIERNARAQAQLIEDLLDMSRITSGKVQLEMRPLLPAAMADAAIETVRPAADAKHIRIDKDYHHRSGMVAADASRLQQIIWNLLSNAIKFTPRGGAIRVAITEAEQHVEIAIGDNGIGIRPEFLAHVFERFRQADSSTTRRHGGLGLGLAIVKQLVEQHGGTVRAASEGEQQGACFTVRLPLAPGAQAAERGGTEALPRSSPDRQGAAPAPVQHDLSGLRVLVVDDEADARELIQRILSDCRAEVLTAATASEALTLLQRERPDLLVSDIGMPEVDGFQLLDQVRALGPGRGGDLPAIALTAFARSEDRIRALACGFLTHISKPVEPAELIAKVAGRGRQWRA